MKFICTLDKMDRLDETKHKEFIDVVPVISCKNSLWIIGSIIYAEGRMQTPGSLTATINPLVQDPGQTGSILI